ATLDHTHRVDRRAKGYTLLLDDVAAADREDIAAGLIAADCGGRHQQCRDVTLQRYAHADEAARQQRMSLILEYSADRDRSGRIVDQWRDVIDLAAMRIAVLGVEPDIDRDWTEILARHALGGQGGAIALQFLIGDIEVHVDRIELQDRRECGRTVRADQ